MPLERINVYKYLDSGKEKAYPKSVVDAIYMDDNENQNVKEYIDETIASKIDEKVPEWAQSETKPEYTASEVGALPDTIEIPVIDNTLSVSGDAADAKVVGDKFVEVDADIVELSESVDENYVKKTDLETDQEKLEKYIEQYYALRRNGKVYQTKLWKFATNPTSEGEKLLSNAGLVFEPSTDTEEGQDDYLNGQHPMFEWVNVNYVRDDDGTARPIAIEGMDNYATSGSVDVGTMQMSFYWKWDTSNAEYDLVTVSDSPHPELGLQPWPECVKADGTILPWCIGSKYISGIASDGRIV